MQPTTKRLVISCAILLVIACLAASVLAISGVGLGAFRLLTAASPNATQTLAPIPSPTTTVVMPSGTPVVTLSPPAGGATTPVPGLTVTASPTSALPAAIQQQMDTIQAQVLSYRDLPLKSPVVRDLLTTAQLKEKVKTDFFKNYTAADAQKDSRVYFAFGWVPPNFDLLTFEINLQSEQVAGYYDNDTKRMYVVSDEGFHGEERLTYAHEFTHVLQDQNFDIKNGLHYSDAACKKATEYCAAVQALMEGDAVLSEETWLQKFGTPQDQADIQAFYNGLKMPVYDSAPQFFKDDLYFPYQQGLEFVQSIYDRGGYPAVNAVFKNPPVDTHQIMHPDDYPAVKPVTVPLPNLTTTLGGTYKQIDANVLGEWDTYLLLADGINPSTRLSKSTASAAAAGWSGDSYAVYDNGTSAMPVVTLVTQWDTASNASQFASAFHRYGDARWGASTTSGTTITWQGQSAFASLTQNGQKTTWILAPSADILQKVTAALK